MKANPELSLYDCIALDMVQKHETIDKDIAARLRKLHLVEGRYPKLFLSAYTAKTVDNKDLKTEYIRNKSFKDLHFKDMIVQYLRSFGGATRAELNELLNSKLSDVLTEEQKIRKVATQRTALKGNERCNPVPVPADTEARNSDNMCRYVYSIFHISRERL